MIPKIERLKLMKPKIEKLKTVAHHQSRKVHRVKATLEALCFTSVASGFHWVEVVISGSLACIIVCLIVFGEEA